MNCTRQTRSYIPKYYEFINIGKGEQGNKFLPLDCEWSVLFWFCIELGQGSFLTSIVDKFLPSVEWLLILDNL